MNIQSEKLALIEWIAGIDDAKVIQNIKAIQKQRSEKDLFKRYTAKVLQRRAESSLEDIREGRTIKLSKLKSEIAEWKKSKGLK